MELMMNVRVTGMRCAVLLFVVFLGIYGLAGIHAITQGCRGISTDCYLEQAQLAKSIQATMVVLCLLDLVCIAFMAIIRLWRFLCGAARPDLDVPNRPRGK